MPPAPAAGPALSEPVREDVRNPAAIQAPGATVNVGVPGTAGVAVRQRGDQWRYRWHNNNWWYWTVENRWVYRNGNEWVNYAPAVAAAPAAGYASQPAYTGQPAYASQPDNGNPSGPNVYTTGYRGYYGPDYQGGYYGPAYQGGYYGPVYRGGYYGPGGYYGQPGNGIGVGYGWGLRIRW
jgi:hypothetical protein